MSPEQVVKKIFEAKRKEFLDECKQYDMTEEEIKRCLEARFHPATEFHTLWNSLEGSVIRNGVPEQGWNSYLNRNSKYL